MILAIDIGNSNIVFGVYANDSLIKVIRTTVNKYLTSDDLKALMSHLLKENDLSISEFEGSIISSVVPNLTLRVKQAVNALLKTEAIVLGPGVKTGLRIELDDPHELGSDLVAGAIGALHKYKSPMVIVDLGTATTFSIIDQKNTFVGGIISPGIRISLGALIRNAEHLPEVVLQGSTSMIGKNTIQAIQIGLVDGAASQIDGIVKRISLEMNQEITVVLTGGLSSLVHSKCEVESILDENLLLDGLYYIYQKNTIK